MQCDFQTIGKPLPTSAPLLNQQPLHSHSFQRHLNCLKSEGTIPVSEVGRSPPLGLFRFPPVIWGRSLARAPSQPCRAEGRVFSSREELSFLILGMWACGCWGCRIKTKLRERRYFTVAEQDLTISSVWQTYPEQCYQNVCCRVHHC